MRKFISIATIAAAGLLAAATPSLARQGADDPKGHVRGEGAGHPVKQDVPVILARQGADDPKGHVRGEGTGHPVKQDVPVADMA